MNPDYKLKIFFELEFETFSQYLQYEQKKREIEMLESVVNDEAVIKFGKIVYEGEMKKILNQSIRKEIKSFLEEEINYPPYTVYVFFFSLVD